jgi:1,4-dihydroxy-2-naphthoate octaprenyltransferase
MHSLAFVILPYLLGVFVAIFSDGQRFDPLLSAIGLLPLMLNHFAANLISDIKDYQKGIDKKPDLFSGGIVRGWITIREAIAAVIILYTIALIAGIFLLIEMGVVLIPFFITGFLLGLFYSIGGNVAFKYNVTGEWFIFFGFGILIPAYGYFLNAGHLSWSHVYLSLPAAFFLAAVKHANNWIAATSPGNLEKMTSASLLGRIASRRYFYALIFMPYILTGILKMLSASPWINFPASMLVVYITLPFFALLLMRAAKPGSVNPVNRMYSMDSLTAMLYIVFMALSCVSLVIG